MKIREATEKETKFYNIFIGTSFVLLSIFFAILSTITPMFSNGFILCVIVSAIFMIAYILFILLLDIIKNQKKILSKFD